MDFLSLKSAVSEQFWDCLTYTKQIEVSTDNNLLLYVLSAKVNPTGQGGLMNLLFLILIFITNYNEAWLCAVNTISNLLKEHEDQVLHQSTKSTTSNNIKQHQVVDQAIKRVKEIILNNEQILAKDKAKEYPAIQRLLRERKKLKVNSNTFLFNQ